MDMNRKKHYLHVRDVLWRLRIRAELLRSATYGIPMGELGQ